MDDGTPPPLIKRDVIPATSESDEFTLDIVPTPHEGDIDQDSDPIPEYLVRSLSRPALRMLWHQRLGHLNFRRLSTMHRFVKGMPEFKLPNELESCPICLAAKLRKQPAGTKTTMRSTVCNQGISIDFGFMVQRSRNTKRRHNLIGLNGETCYALITDHFSGRLYGRAFASKAPPVDWINNWLANNDPKCPNKYVRMDGGGELGKSDMSARLSQILGTPWKIPVRIRLIKTDLENDLMKPSATPSGLCYPVRVFKRVFGPTRSTTTYVYTTSSHTALDQPAHMRCAVPNC